MIPLMWLVASVTLMAQPDDAPPPSDSDATWRAWDSAAPPTPLWQLRFDADAWYTAAAGDIKLPGSPPVPQTTTLAELNLDSPSIGPGGTAQFRRGPWRLSLAGWTSSIENGATMVQPGQIGDLTFGPGDRLESTLRQTTLEATVGYRLFEARRGPEADGGSRVVFGVDATAGLRAHQFDLDVTGPGGAAGSDEWFLEPVIGAGIEIDLWKQVAVDLSVQGGANAGILDNEATSADIAVGFEWRPWQHVGLRVGYRLMSLDLIEGEGQDQFEFQGSNAGLVFGVSARF